MTKTSAPPTQQLEALETKIAICELFKDGRERTLDDVATRIKKPAADIKMHLHQLARAGALVKDHWMPIWRAAQ